MERAKLIVKNFGPLKDIEIEVREMVTFIGAQASGKSTLAKLLSIFEDKNFRRDEKITFENELKKYNMFSFLREDSFINYINNQGKAKYSYKLEKLISEKTNSRENIKENFYNSSVLDEQMKILSKLFVFDLETGYFKTQQQLLNFRNEVDLILKELLNKGTFKDFFERYDQLLSKFNIFVLFDSIYIPSERNFLHLIAENTLGLLNNNIQIPKHLLNSGQDYEKAIQTIKELPLTIIDKKLTYKREGKTSYIYHNENEKVDLLE